MHVHTTDRNSPGNKQKFKSLFCLTDRGSRPAPGRVFQAPGIGEVAVRPRPSCGHVYDVSAETLRESFHKPLSPPASASTRPGY